MQCKPTAQVTAKLYEEGACGQVRSLEDVGICHDALFLFLLQGGGDLFRHGGLEGRLAVIIDRLQNVLEALETRSNATATGDEGNAPTDTWLAAVDHVRWKRYASRCGYR